MDVERTLADYAADLVIDQVPGSVLIDFRRLMLDTAGVIMAGWRNRECRSIVEKFLAWGGTAVSSLAGRSEKIPPPGAAFGNGVYAHWTEWDDTHDASHVHASAVIFPALWAVSEAAGLDQGRQGGTTFVAATIAAFDIACRIGGLLKPHAHRGWMPTGSGGTVGAAAGAAKLLGLDRRGILSAMGLAAAGAGLFRQALADKTTGKNILAGVAAQNAVESVFLAAAGVSGAPGFLIGPYGLQALHAGGRGDAGTIAADLGHRFSITEVSIKPYPCCRSNHPAIDLVLDALKKDPSLKDKVNEVHVFAPEGLFERCGAPFDPGDNPRVSAQFSMPYTVALALTRGEICPEDFESEAVLSDVYGISGLAKRVLVHPTPLPPGGDDVMTPLTAAFHLKDGRILKYTTDNVKGSPDRPLTADEERTKLSQAAGNALTADQLEALIEAVTSTLDRGPSALMAQFRNVGAASTA
jgi:2-methylcitrate dehydratase PrpD